MCTRPLIAYRYGVDKDTGKYKIKLKYNRTFSLDDYYKKYGKENILLIPCGKCSECLLKRRQEWAVRCACESLDHNVSCFITLTYDDLHLSPLNKKHPIDFIKSLRNKGFKIRYFGCGERGERTLRPHYHIVVFGYLPDDLIYIGESKSGQALYSSKFIDDLWSFGTCSVQLFTPEVAGYVAGYTSKKLGATDSFQFQSTKPGLGYNYIIKHKDTFLKYKRIFGDFGVSKKSYLPRYFKKVLENNGYSLILDLISEESQKINDMKLYQKARLHSMDHIDEAVFYNARYCDKKFNKLVREL